MNHNGDLQKAHALVDAAVAAGVDYVKFQTFSADRLVTQSAAKADYQIAATGQGETQHEMLQRLALSEAAHLELKRHCEDAGIRFLSTGFDTESLDFLVRLGIDLIKIPSGEITNLPYLRHAARLGLPLVVSTGMADLEEVEATLAALERAGSSRAAMTVLHCTTEYPAAMADVNLRAMVTMRQRLDVRVGYSDHTLGIAVPVAAVALGAEVVEKHFTLDRNLPGPDHKASLEPNELACMVAAIRDIEAALGGDDKRPCPVEIRNRAVARKSIVAARAIAAGEFFCPENLTVKRPGTGLSPMRWDEVVGRAAPRSFLADELIEL